MKRSFFVFAAGWPGAALFLLRCSVAVFLVALPCARLGYSTWAALAVDALAALVLFGLQTRVAAAFAALVAILQITDLGGLVLMPFVAHALDAAVLAMAGPGAYSIDARLFGRRTVRLPE